MFEHSRHVWKSTVCGASTAPAETWVEVAR